jgi:hypothetical protein
VTLCLLVIRYFDEMNRDLRAEIMTAIEQQCGNVGFRRRASVYFTKSLNADTIGVLAFVPNKDEQILVVPSLAVRYQPLERLVAELTGEKFHPYLSGTLACPLGHVPPLQELLWFYFSADEDPTARLQEMFRIVEQIAIPWMERHPDLDSFIKDLQSGYRFAHRDSVQLRLPAAYYLKKDFSRARSLALKALEEIGEQDGPVSSRYRKFADSLLARLPADSAATQ